MIISLSFLNPRGFAPRHASAEASAMSAVALAKAELPYTRSRAPLRRRAPIAWLARCARSHSTAVLRGSLHGLPGIWSERRSASSPGVDTIRRGNSSHCTSSQSYTHRRGDAARAPCARAKSQRHGTTSACAVAASARLEPPDATALRRERGVRSRVTVPEVLVSNAWRTRRR
jgi:hypothetical protein